MTNLSNDDIDPAELELCEAAQAIGHKNAKFFALTPEKQRVSIAKDVLKWLKLGKLTPQTGRYIMQSGTRQPHEDDRVNGDRCTACALGALFACAIEKRGGGVKNFWYTGNRNGNNELYPYLTPYFDKEQLQLIESAFECNSRWGNFTDEAEKAAAFGNNVAPKSYPLDYAEFLRRDRRAGKLRMTAIMQNIIKNNGTFKP